ncbi:hypothetical protein GR160_18205 [Flavobacterium sp. Sd200]|uniref:hypothetical protein n=1 Tax=Flavobacterium sp. Sd200 TaxID=2692211 RepID=UPI00136808B5|nr:hypothetical protein [Flavobacterium sp. Sd200]MXN93165.1 hypothetical protein [Flavobacterium sp. Sd200]
MAQYIFNLEERFQPFLLEGYYTFIGPANQELLGDFTSTVNRIAPLNNINNSLSNKSVVKQVLNTLYPDSPLKIYVAEGNHSSGLAYNTIEEYCDRFHIEFNLIDF